MRFNKDANKICAGGTAITDNFANGDTSIYGIETEINRCMEICGYHDDCTGFYYKNGKCWVKSGPLTLSAETGTTCYIQIQEGTCYCTNGVAVLDNFCPEDGRQVCQSCDSGYAKQGGICMLGKLYILKSKI